MAKLPGDKMKDLNEVGITGYGLRAEIKPEFLIAQTKQGFPLEKTLMPFAGSIARQLLRSGRAYGMINLKYIFNPLKLNCKD